MSGFQDFHNSAWFAWDFIFDNFNFLTLVGHSSLRFVHCCVPVQVFVTWVVNQMGEFTWLENNSGNSHVAAQMVVSGLQERTVYGGAEANYSSSFGIGAGLTCRNRILGFLGCIFKLQVLQTFAAHENGTSCLNLWVWSLIYDKLQRNSWFSCIIKHDLCRNSYVAFCSFSLFEPRKLNGREDSASPHIAVWALVVFSKLSRTWTMQVLLQQTFFF